MNLFIRQTFVLLRKDLVSELREPHHFLSVLLFGLVLLLLFSFALSVEPDLMQKMAPGLFWLAILFASILTLNHSFQRETEEGQWEGLLLLGIDSRALYLGKMLANLCMVLVLQLSLLPLMAVLFDITLSWPLLVVLLMGSLGIAILGTCYAGLTASLRGGQVLLPLLLFPMLVPVLLAAVKVTQLILTGDLLGEQALWFKLLILFDTVFLLGCLLSADTFFDRS